MDETPPPVLLVEHILPGVALFRINRPEAKNALNMAVRQALASSFAQAAKDKSLRCIVLTGDENSFAAGADIREMVDVSGIELYQRHNERLWAAIADCPLPVIAAVNGFALGGGMELAMHADIIVAGQSARLGQPEVKLGIMPGAGGTQRLVRAVGKFQAMRICLTGDLFTAANALNMGLVSAVVPDDETLPEALRLAAQIAAMPPLAVGLIKEIILQGADIPLAAALTLERKGLQFLFGSSDKQEGMQAFLEKRKPQFTGC
ncbi:enoyl-CoA hydratase-related protein [Pseudorhodobacter sp. W20_MBD10_FR17]|uniref:enoyl-CoA hydratase-related protein n=1 Tax=Pseudorhodobacter sp. W20_MBD10_FR17 TaxID=3240266 RepID=UPI003F96A37B